MKVQPASLGFDATGAPYSERYGDVYGSREGALGQARHVFLGGNGLPGRWRGREQFVVLETGFGLGTNFLATWDAWSADAERPRRMHFVSVEQHPLAALDLVAAAPEELKPLAAVLVQQWPLPLPGLHRLEFDDGRVCLTLGLGDARELLPQLVVGADAIYLDGFAPSRNPEMWEATLIRAVGRCARPGATVATYTTAQPVQRALAAAGFDVGLRTGYGRKREMLVGRFAPRWQVRRHEPPQPYGGERSAIVIGAGLAGSACAHALSRRGWAVQVIDAAAAPASAASALPWGLLHPQMAADDAPLARLSRAGVLATRAALTRTVSSESHNGRTVARLTGVFQIADDDKALARWQTGIGRLGLPREWVELIDIGQATSRIGMAPRRAGLWWPLGALISPARWSHALLAGSALRLGCPVARLERKPDGWVASDDDGRVLAVAPVAIVAAALGSPPLMRMSVPLRPVRGRVTSLDPGPFAELRAPITGDGYLLRDPDGGATAGATYEFSDDVDGGAELSEERATQGNIARVSRLLLAPPSVRAIGVFDGVRCVARDRLPLAGVVVDENTALAGAAALRGAQLDELPSHGGLYCSVALGSRGLALAPLMAELIAARIGGEPLPLERSLAVVVDPGRFLLQLIRRGGL